MKKKRVLHGRSAIRFKNKHFDLFKKKSFFICVCVCVIFFRTLESQHVAILFFFSEKNANRFWIKAVKEIAACIEVAADWLPDEVDHTESFDVKPGLLQPFNLLQRLRFYLYICTLEMNRK